MTTSAAAVSAALRRGGLRPLGSGTSRMREGIRVSKFSVGAVRVGFDFDSDRLADRLCSDAFEILTTSGYQVDRPADYAALIVRRDDR